MMQMFEVFNIYSNKGTAMGYYICALPFLNTAMTVVADVSPVLQL